MDYTSLVFGRKRSVVRFVRNDHKRDSKQSRHVEEAYMKICRVLYALHMRHVVFTKHLLKFPNITYVHNRSWPKEDPFGNYINQTLEIG
jgi:hypothetical protein